MEPTRIALKSEKFGQSSEGFALRRDFTTDEKVKRAGKALGILWLVAFFTVFIPILHFVLVPLFFLGGIGFAVVTYMEKGLLLSGEIPCPNCKKPVTLPEETESWPNARRCPSCHTDLIIDVAKPATP